MTENAGTGSLFAVVRRAITDPANVSAAEEREAIAALKEIEAENARLREALAKYADARHWGMERDFRYPRAVWIGPGADQPVPDPPGIARSALKPRCCKPGDPACNHPDCSCEEMR